MATMKYKFLLEGQSQVDPNLYIGVSAIDREHAVLLHQMNRLIDDSAASSDSEKLSDILSRLGTQLAAHISHEEEYLATLPMPAEDLASHRAAHVTILEQYCQLNMDQMLHKSPNRDEILTKFRAWIVDHIIEHDLKIRDYASANRRVAS